MTSSIEFHEAQPDDWEGEIVLKDNKPIYIVFYVWQMSSKDWLKAIHRVLDEKVGSGWTVNAKSQCGGNGHYGYEIVPVPVVSP